MRTGPAAGLRATATDEYRRVEAESPGRLVTWSGTGSVELLGTRLGVRPMPVDGEPIVGPAPDVPGLYLAVMHAVTFA
ncbi:MAG: hypothetical protein M3422_10555, partial [Actinomycetota bacterium]|nr:hypothetical protein [Actinomycetota bacterium]